MEFGGYRILELVAQGGMGMVYRAYDLRLHREVALKTLRVRDPVVRQRFRRECEALAQARHPHVMPCYAAGEHEGEPYLVLPLLRGETLAARLVRGPLSLAEAVRIGARLADALAFLHARGILHRDLKPDNVLFDEQGEPLIADFGLVKLESSEQPLERLTLSGAMLGTPQFWPPEQATGQVARIGPASDVYGLGATLYCVLSGRPPQLAETLGELVEALDRLPPPLGSLRPDVPASLARLVHDCLAKDPEARPRAAEVARALSSGEGSGGRLDYAGGPPRRRGLALFALTTLLVVGGVAAAVWGRRAEPAPGPAPQEGTLEVEAPERPPPWAAALADGDWVGLAARARRGAFSVDELVSLREAVLRVALRQPFALPALRAQVELLGALREAGAPAYPWGPTVNDAWAAARLVDPAWRGAESEGRLLAEAFTAAVIADVKDRGPYAFPQPPLFPDAIPDAPRELLEGLVAAGLPLGDRETAQLAIHFLDLRMHPLTPTDRWRVIAALVALGVDVHTEKFQPLEAQPGGWDQGSPAERLLYAMSRGQRARVEAWAGDAEASPGLRAYAAWWLLEHEGDPARWGPVVALDPGWTFGAIALARALQATDPADPRLEGLVRGAVEQAEAIHGLPLHMANSQLNQGFLTWPRCALWADAAELAARHGWGDVERRALANVRAISVWRYLVAGLRVVLAREDVAFARRLVREAEVEQARQEAHLAQARSDKDRLKRAGELDAARTAHEQLRQALAQLERR